MNLHDATSATAGWATTGVETATLTFVILARRSNTPRCAQILDKQILLAKVGLLSDAHGGRSSGSGGTRLAERCASNRRPIGDISHRQTLDNLPGFSVATTTRGLLHRQAPCFADFVRGFIHNAEERVPLLETNQCITELQPW